MPTGIGAGAIIHTAFQAAQETASTIKTGVGKFLAYCVKKISSKAVTARNQDMNISQSYKSAEEIRCDFNRKIKLLKPGELRRKAIRTKDNEIENVSKEFYYRVNDYRNYMGSYFDSALDPPEDELESLNTVANKYIVDLENERKEIALCIDHTEV